MNAKRIAAIALCLGLVLPAWAATRRWAVSQNLTGTAPASDCNPSEVGSTKSTGLSLAGLQQYYVCVQANSGQTLSGAGTLKAYFWDPDLSEWAHEKDGDLAITVAAAADREQCFPARPVVGGYGCAYYVPDAVTVSGGTTVLVTATGVH